MTETDRNTERNRQARRPAAAPRIWLSVRVLEPLLPYLTARGHDIFAFLKGQGLDPLIFRDREARLPHLLAASPRGAAARRTNDADWEFMWPKESGPGLLEPWATPGGPARPCE